MNAFDRDGISGWGAVVHIIEKDKEYIYICIFPEKKGFIVRNCGLLDELEFLCQS